MSFGGSSFQAQRANVTQNLRTRGPDIKEIPNFGLLLKVLGTAAAHQSSEPQCNERTVALFCLVKKIWLFVYWQIKKLLLRILLAHGHTPRRKPIGTECEMRQ